MLDWDTASPAVKATLLGAVSCFGAGVLLAIIGVATNLKWLMFFAIGLLALGVICHLVGFGVRMADQRRRLREAAARDAAKAAKKGKK